MIHSPEELIDGLAFMVKESDKLADTVRVLGETLVELAEQTLTLREGKVYRKFSYQPDTEVELTDRAMIFVREALRPANQRPKKV